MSTNNFTPITTGAAANASVVNTPMGQLDAVIGLLSTLGTTDKSSLVAALNELQVLTNTQIGTLASLGTATKTNLVVALNEVRNNAIVGGIYVTQAQLKAWTESESFEATSITMDSVHVLVVASATVKWPDGSAGTFTTVLINATWEGIDAYNVSHATSGYTVTQAAVTRNIDGAITTKPALTVS